jgi:four helix bundle protein
MHNLKELIIYHKAMSLAEQVYTVTSVLPKEETYGLKAQIRRSAISIPSNIAEGAGRNTTGEFCHFLGISNGSSYELLTQIVLANRFKMISDQSLQPLILGIEEIQKMNFKLQQHLQASKQQKPIK